MRGPVSQSLHIAYEVGYFLISLVSRVFNAINGGSMHQTYSARVHIEARTNPEWHKTEKLINRIFFWQVNHCAAAWQAEVTRARKTLMRNDLAGGF